MGGTPRRRKEHGTLRGPCRGYAPRCKPTPPLPSHGQPTTHSMTLQGRHRGGGPRASGPRSAGAGARRTYGVCHSGLVADRAGRGPLDVALCLCSVPVCGSPRPSRKCALRSGCKMPDAPLVQSSDPLVTKEMPGQGAGDPGGDAARQAYSPFPSAKRGAWLTQAPPGVRLAARVNRNCQHVHMLHCQSTSTK